MVPGQVIFGRYQILGEIGQGGTATVYVALDARIQRKVAIKRIALRNDSQPSVGIPARSRCETVPIADYVSGFDDVSTSRSEVDYTDDEGITESINVFSPTRRFGIDADNTAVDAGVGEAVVAAGNGGETLPSAMPGLDEARMAAKIVDPTIVAVYDCEIDRGFAYLIMEYVEGISLARLVQDHNDQITIDMIAAVFSEVSRALEVAHGQNILHLDIKPSNILIDAAGHVKVTDFGIATLVDAQGFGRAGAGTVGYMPPEQIRLQALDARTDEWALASVMYELLSGSNPLIADSFEDALRVIDESELLLPSLCWPDVPDCIDDVVFRALDPDPVERYPSVTDFADELSPLLGDVARGHSELAEVVAEYLMNQAIVESVGSHASDGSDGPASSVEEGLTFDDDGEGEDGEPDNQRERKRSSRLRRPIISWRKIVMSLLGACASTLVTYVGLANLPFQISIGNVAFWVPLAAMFVFAFFLTGMAMHISVLFLGVVIIANGAPVLGLLTIVGGSAWWILAGRRGREQSSGMLAFPLFGSVGVAPLATVFCGGFQSMLGAAVSSLAGSLLTVVIASFGSGIMFNLGLPYSQVMAGNDLQGNALDLFSDPGTWVIIAGLVIASCLLSLVARRGGRMAFVGAGLSFAALLSSVCIYHSPYRGVIFVAPSPEMLVPVLIAGALAFFFAFIGAFGPDARSLGDDGE